MPRITVPAADIAGDRALSEQARSSEVAAK